MIKPLLALAYPSVIVVCSCNTRCFMDVTVLLCGTLFCDDHQLVDVSRCEKHPWSTGRWWFRYLVFGLTSAFGLFFKVMPMYALLFSILLFF